MDGVSIANTSHAKHGVVFFLEHGFSCVGSRGAPQLNFSSLNNFLNFWFFQSKING